MKKTMWLAPAFALTLVAVMLFASQVPASLAQQDQQRRKGTETTPGGCFICGNMQGMHTAMFKGADWFGTVAWNACPIKKYSEDHPEELKSACLRIKAQLNITSFKVSCPSLAPYCEPEDKQPPDAKCQPPQTNNSPWFNRDSPCRTRQRGTISWSQTPASTMDLQYTVSMCGEVVRFTRRGAGSSDRTPPGARSFDVCCDSWRSAANSGSPCDARRDIDCDGVLNEQDGAPEKPYGNSDDFAINSPTMNLPFWKKLYPEMPDPIGCKDCKWELVRVEYTCQELERRYEAGWESSNANDAAYNFQAFWKCAATGQIVEKGGNVRMDNLKCPREWTQTTNYWP